MRHIFGIRVRGTRIRIRKGSKVLFWALCLCFICSFSNYTRARAHTHTHIRRYFLRCLFFMLCMNWLDNNSFVMPVYLGKSSMGCFLFSWSSGFLVFFFCFFGELVSSFVMVFVADGFSTGAYDDEEAAARAYDLAALKYWGPGTLINFPVR